MMGVGRRRGANRTGESDPTKATLGLSAGADGGRPGGRAAGRGGGGVQPLDKKGTGWRHPDKADEVMVRRQLCTRKVNVRNRGHGEARGRREGEARLSVTPGGGADVGHTRE